MASANPPRVAMATGSATAAGQQANYDEGYKNWLKSARALIVVRDAIGQDIEQEFIKFHQGLKKKCGSMCHSCTHKDVVFDKKSKSWKLKKNCQKNCQKWVDEVSNEHRMKLNSGKVYWANTDMTKWETDPWEIAKFYMPKGQGAANKGPSDTDFAAMASLIGNCNVFDKKIVQNSNTVSTVRNKIMHSPNMEVNNLDMTQNIDKLLDFLKVLPPRIFNIKPDVLKELTKLKQDNILLPGEKAIALEVDALRDRIKELVRKLEDKENAPQDEDSVDGSHDLDKEALQSTLALLTSRPDLFDKLELDIDNARSNLDKLSTTVQKVTDTQQQHAEDIADIKEQLRRLCQNKGNLKGSATSNFKGSLLSIAQAEKWPSPIYKATPHISGEGFVASVTINGQTYTISEPCGRKVDAEQEVAKMALPEVKKLVESSGSVATNFKGSLLSLAQTEKWPNPTFKTTPHLSGGFEASVTINGQTYTNTESFTRKVDAEQNVAKLALGKLVASLGTDNVGSADGPSSGATVTQDATENQGASAGSTPAKRYDIDLCFHNDAGKSTWQATAKLRVKGAMQLSPSQSKMKKSEAEHELSVLVLKRLGLEPSEKPRDALYGYCGKNKFKVPKYYSTKCIEDQTKFTSIVISNCLTSEEDIEIAGDSATDEDAARKSVVESVKAFLQDNFEDSELGEISVSGENADGSVACKKPKIACDQSLPTEVQACTSKDSTLASTNPSMACEFSSAKASAIPNGKIELELQVHKVKSVWQATAKFKVVGALQLPANQIKSKKAEAKQAVAELVLKKLGIPMKSAQNDLYAYCGSKQTCSKPEYVEVKQLGGAGFGCVIITDCLTSEEEILLVSDESTSEEDARKSVKEKVQEILAKVPGNHDIGKITDVSASASTNSIATEETKKACDGASASATINVAENNQNSFCSKDKIMPESTKSSPVNYVGKLNEFYQKNKDFVKVKDDCKEEAGPPKTYRCEITMKGLFKEVPTKSYKSKKEAEKGIAAYVLSKLFPSVSLGDPNQAKNKLQESTIKIRKENKPSYTSVQDAESKEFQSKCTLDFIVCPKEWSKEKSSSKQEAARLVLEIIQDQM